MGKQNVSDNVLSNRGGGNSMALGLSAAALAAIGGAYAALSPAWFLPRQLEGGDITPNDEVEELENEDGEVDEEIVLKRRERISETTRNTSDEMLDLLDALARENLRFPVRKPLPTSEEGAGGEPLHQLWYFPHCRVVRDGSGINLGNGVRKRKFVIEAELTEAMRAAGYKEPYVRATVDMADEVSWPATLEDAKDAAFQAV